METYTKLDIIWLRDKSNSYRWEYSLNVQIDEETLIKTFHEERFALSFKGLYADERPSEAFELEKVLNNLNTQGLGFIITIDMTNSEAGGKKLNELLNQWGFKFA